MLLSNLYTFGQTIHHNEWATNEPTIQKSMLVIKHVFISVFKSSGGIMLDHIKGTLDPIKKERQRGWGWGRIWHLRQTQQTKSTFK